MTLWNFDSFSSHFRWCRISVARDTMEFGFLLLSLPLVWSTPLGLPECGWEEAEEEEEDNSHIDTWRNVRVWVDFFGGLHL